MADTGDKVTRKYQGFRGIDLRGEECSLNRSPDCLNVWRNYKKLSCIETRPGLELFTRVKYLSEIRSMIWYNDELYCLDEEGNLLIFKADGTLVESGVSVGQDGMLFTFDGRLYALGHSDYIDVTAYEDIIAENKGTKPDNILELSRVQPFIPTTTINRKPLGGGEVYQDVNLLTGWRYNTFTADGESYYTLDGANGVNDDYSEEKGAEVWINDRKISAKYYYYHAGAGTITFHEEGEYVEIPKEGDKVKVKFWVGDEAESNKRKRQIANCTLFQEFDNRLFVSGNPSLPSTVWHSALHDVSYFSDLDYYIDGEDGASIRSIVAGNNGLWVFRDSSEANSSVFYHTPALDGGYGKVYPSSHSSIDIGCKGRAVNFNDDTVFFSERGMESASTDITTEQFATHRSSLVDRRMITHDNYKKMILAEWEGYLLVFMGSDVYLADSRAVHQVENHIEYEWFHWNLGCDVTAASVHNGVLYLATYKNGGNFIHTLTGKPQNGDRWPGTEGGEDQHSFDSYWTTPKDTFNAPNKQKTTNKKGCIIEALGNIEVWAKTEGESDFEHIVTARNVEDFFVSRIKRKKFKDLQLRFKSKEGFSLESVTMECFVGGYIKRAANVKYTTGDGSGSGTPVPVPNAEREITLKDQNTDQAYKIYVEDGKLTMEKKE